MDGAMNHASGADKTNPWGYDAPSRPKANLRTALQHRPTCSVALPDAPVLALDTTGS